MQAFKVILVVACLAGVASAASWSSDAMCQKCTQTVDSMKQNIHEIEKRILDACNLIPDQMNRDKCIKGEKDFVNYLNSKTTEQICQDFNQCPRALLGLGGQEEPTCALCEPCKQMAQMFKGNAAQFKDQLKGLCKNCGAPENVKKCEQAIDNFINDVENKSPEELCAEIGLCKKH